MRSSRISPCGALGTALLTSLALLFVLPAGSQAHVVKTHASTGHATHLRGATGLLTGVIYPNGSETSYYFQYGPTTAYGSQTPTASAGKGTAKVAVGQPISGLTPGVTYHFRLVIVIGGETHTERDKSFVAGGVAKKRLVFKLAKTKTADVYGRPIIVSGMLSGLGSANAPIALQASLYPYLEPFVNIGAPGTTNAVGAFSFRVSNLAMSTQFRVVTLASLPVYSPVLTEQVAIGVTLHVSATKRAGFVRMYGFVTPTKVGTPIIFQLEKKVRPHGKSESDARYLTVSTSKLRRGGKTFSRFSAIVEIRHAGRYRAYVKLGKGPLVSGTSNGVEIRGTVPTRARRHHKRKR